MSRCAAGFAREELDKRCCILTFCSFGDYHDGQKSNADSARFSTAIAKRFEEDLILDGKRPLTVKAYRNAIAQLAETFGTSPQRLSEAQVRTYLIDRRKALALNSMRPILAAIKFLYRVTLPRDWATLAAMRLPKSHTVPKVLPPEQCWRIINSTQKLYLRAAMQVAFTSGLRSVDVRQLSPKHIDGQTRTIHIVNSKGARQRSVPIPEVTLGILREYWAQHRNPTWLFPSRDKLSKIAVTDKPISARSLQRGTLHIVESLGWGGKGIVFHTFRHSYATAMLDEGANIKVVGRYLGHKNLQATEVYLHFTRRGDEKARRIVDQIFGEGGPN